MEYVKLKRKCDQKMKHLSHSHILASGNRKPTKQKSLVGCLENIHDQFCENTGNFVPSELKTQELVSSSQHHDYTFPISKFRDK